MVEVCLIAPAYPDSAANDIRRHGISLTLQPRKESSLRPFALPHNMDAFLPFLAQLSTSGSFKV